MIKITRNFPKFAEEHRKNILSKTKIKAKLDIQIATTSVPEQTFYQYLKDHINEILENDIDYLKSTIIDNVERILGIDYFTLTDTGSTTKTNKATIEIILDVFDYKYFTTYKKTIYCAYDLVEKLDIKVCPYCNRQYINTLKPDLKDNGKTRATLDHFYIKAEYPYLALSFWNLVPSCYSCNSQLRTTKPISLHPYKKGFEEILHFYTEISDISEFIGNSRKQFELKLDKYKKVNPAPEDLKNAKENDQVFRLNDIYQNHKDYVREMIQKTIVYDDSYSKELFVEFDGLFESEYDAQNMMLGNYTKVDDFEKRPLAKLTRDIGFEIGLIK